MNDSTELPVAASDLATNSVDGQRGRPSGVMRLDLLKVVGSSPAFLASPEGVSPEWAAKRSSAFQIWLWVSMRTSVTMQASPIVGDFVTVIQHLGIITVSPWGLARAVLN